MFTKQNFIIVCIIATTLAHAAGHDPKTAVTAPSSNVGFPNFIGIASSADGLCVLDLPEHIEPGKDYPITVVYTEMPELKSAGNVSKIAALFATANKSPNFSKELFDAALQQIIEEYTIPSTHLGKGYSQLELDAVILCINISQSGVRSYASYPMYMSAPELSYCKNTICMPHHLSNEELMYTVWHGARPKPVYLEQLPCPPTDHAQALYKKASVFDKWTLVVNIEKLRAILGAAKAIEDHS